MNKLQKLATCAALACATSIANASTITSATVYENTPDPGDASSSRNMTGGLDSANFTIGSAGINFLSSSGTTIATFLNNPTFSNQRHSFDPNAPLNSGSLGTEIVITGNLSLNAGANTFVVGHDDGVVLNIAGFGNVVNAPGPTSFSTSPFTVTAATAGDYAFTLEYAECCALPADLVFNVNNAPVGGTAVTPEPSSLGSAGNRPAWRCAASIRRRFGMGA